MTGNNTNARRRFLTLLTEMVLAVIGLLVAIPGLGYFCAPLRRKGGPAGTEADFEDVGLLSDIPVGKWHLLTLQTVNQDGWTTTRVHHAVWIHRHSEAEQDMSVLSSICPHLGCPINWFPDKSEFSCPCHGGTFDSQGRRIAGPPPRNMDPLQFEVRAGRLWVRWQDFKIGVAQRVPVSV